VIKKAHQLLTLRSISIGFSAAVLALACGAEDKNNPEGPIRPLPEDPCANPLNVGCTVTNPPDEPTGSGGGGNTPVKPPDNQPVGNLAKAAVENILASNCGYCHGPALTDAQAKAGMNYINDIERLADEGKIVPLSSATSKVVQRMVRGEMPPQGSGYPAVTQTDIDTVAAYIDNQQFWPNEPIVDCTGDEQLVDFDDLYIEINKDLAGEDADDTQFYRYVSLTNRFTAGVCKEALDKDRQALTKMLNMLSIRASIEEPLPINSEETIYRIDLRDFDWNRAISVDGQAFTDVWEAIALNNPYAVEFVGDDVDETKEETLTDIPLMFADQMMDVAIIGNLYYAIIDVDVTQTLGNFIAVDLGINLADNLANEDSIRAGTTKSRISRQDRLVQRDDIEVRGGALWQSFDFADDANESIFEDPFGFAAGGTEAIFTLPNGMLGYIIADENDAIVEDSDILLDTNQNNFKAITAVSCSNCHASGFIPVVDEVAEISIDNARQLDLNRDEIEQLEAIYVSPTVFARQVKDDSTAFYQSALQRANLPTLGGDPVSNTFLRFDADMRLADAAGDLGVTPEELEDNLQLLDPVLSVLENGTLDRDDFTNQYIGALCELSSNLENAPDEAICDALEQ
jgi:mono/diheme cytochrome c family protein